MLHFHTYPKQVVSIVVGVLLAIRFHFDDSDSDMAAAAAVAVLEHRNSKEILKDDDELEVSTEASIAKDATSSTSSSNQKYANFIIGDFEGCVSDATTQTETKIVDNEIRTSAEVHHVAHYSSNPSSNQTLADCIPPPSTAPAFPRGEADCLQILREAGPSDLTDEEVLNLAKSGKIPAYNLGENGVKLWRII